MKTTQTWGYFTTPFVNKYFIINHNQNVSSQITVCISRKQTKTVAKILFFSSNCVGLTLGIFASFVEKKSGSEKHWAITETTNRYLANLKTNAHSIQNRYSKMQARQSISPPYLCGKKKRITVWSCKSQEIKGVTFKKTIAQR